tara:strand:+ start:179 stop:1249 length:1071 start_codon:yes stop_codon:yes gene_type:complete
LPNIKNTFHQHIISWYTNNKRSLPFRKTKDPYKIWLSEVMLQQTKVKTAIPYYNNWIKKLPTLESVSLSKLDSLLKLWEGLGYYKRCNNFHKATKLLVSDFNSKIPKEKSQFMSLPGVGDYTASAVLSIAFNKPYPVLDGNVKRVMSRVIGIKTLTKYNIKRINKFLNLVICKKNPGDFNQGLMEIGALICKPYNPVCKKCPINNFCYASKKRLPEAYPGKNKLKPRPHFNVAIAIIWRKNKFYIQKRSADQMLGGLWEFPGVIFKQGQDPEVALKQKVYEECGVHIKIFKNVGFVDHAFSHFKIRLNGYFCIEKKYFLDENENRKWILIKNIKNYSFPKANHKLFNQLELNNWYV